MEKLGIIIPTTNDLYQLYNTYDADQSGSLDYNEFAAIVTRKRIGGTTQMSASQSGFHKPATPVRQPQV